LKTSTKLGETHSNSLPFSHYSSINSTFKNQPEPHRNINPGRICPRKFLKIRNHPLPAHAG
ncbi:MAG: hypothetical protein IKJ45_08845, partial [Kiritimatiellae bacterium]|nr:hypothetical protein [Kiritimatiellia bacterium]